MHCNGHSLEAEDVACVLTMLAVASGTLDEAGFAEWIRRHAQRR
jgi:death-on-curing protein